ncbi:DUF5370 family protein [Fictibacillus gelatini]|uniref:DUF5370 family protein n=1 Tax=Fictibacillus gelatini TaxID=225985 RepID=UPI000425D2A7|nr:DUF5370 family protein [Fictibacillus gelatini]
MGAIERNGHMFEVEYSILLQKGGVHVYKDGEFLKELEFTFSGNQPDPEQIEQLVNSYFEER